MTDKPLPSRDVMYKALCNRDHSFEGIFFAGIVTTGIFCRPGCTARKPKQENVEYYTSTKEAMSHGYRPCKICNPMEQYGSIPKKYRDLLTFIQTHPDEIIKDYHLRERGIEPATLRRWFKKHHGMTFHAYARSFRINRAFGQIKKKNGIIDSALDSGYESLSGFHTAFKKLTGFAPSKSRTQQLITVFRLLTPLGPMFAGSTEQGICLLEFWDRRMLITQFKRLNQLFNAKFVHGDNEMLLELGKQIDEYFKGNRQSFDIPLDLKGSEFQVQAWKELLSIPYGETRSYQQQAIKIDNPNAVRAVAKANGDNRISIIIPCHRVIAKDGQLAGYGGGLWRKKYLLDLESRFK